MKIALLLAANPKVSSGGPFVQVPHGEWAISFVGVNDSEFTIEELAHSEPFPLYDHDTIHGGYYRVRFKHCGTEPFVSVYAVTPSKLEA